MSAKAGSANLITGTRILCSIALLFCQTFSPPFFALYIIAGLTDMIDGTVARKAGTVSEFGAKLDTMADFALVAACLIKLVPVLEFPSRLFIWIAIVALIKAINIISGYVMYRFWRGLYSKDENQRRFHAPSYV